MMQQSEQGEIPSVIGRRLQELTASLQGEARLIEELGAALERQRGGVAADDAAAIETSVQAVSRTLLTLEAARRRRVELTEHLAGREGAGLDELERELGRALPAPLVQAREAVRRAAAAVQRQAAINQTVLRRALDAADAYLQALFSGAAEPSPVYQAAARPAEHRPSGVLLNRKG
jgi:hypothetical protein